MLGRKKKRATVESVVDSWTVARTTYDGLPMLVRVNNAYRGAADRNRYPIRIGVALPLHTPDALGWPAGPEGEELQHAEDLLLAAVRGRAVEVAVITGKSMREFVFYSQASDWIGDFHQEAAAAISSHEVQVIGQTDPGWTVYEGLLPG